MANIHKKYKEKGTLDKERINLILKIQNILSKKIENLKPKTSTQIIYILFTIN